MFQRGWAPRTYGRYSLANSIGPMPLETCLVQSTVSVRWFAFITGMLVQNFSPAHTHKELLPTLTVTLIAHICHVAESQYILDIAVRANFMPVLFHAYPLHIKALVCTKEEYEVIVFLCNVDRLLTTHKDCLSVLVVPCSLL